MKVAGVTVEIGGRKRMFRFSYLAMTGMCAEFGLEKLEEMPQLFDGMKIDVFESLLFHGFMAGAKYQGQQVDFERSDIPQWIDEDMQLVMAELIPNAMEQLTQSLSGGDNAPKKKLSAKKL